MPDYKMMYKVLFQTMTHCIDEMQKAQLTTEELYISGDEPNITILPLDGSNDEDGDQS